ncbi:hypothetical protein K1X84_05190 [bacterium]|nr:hypothetical protein [bacterium]
MKWFEARIVILLVVAAMFYSACDGDTVTIKYIDLTNSQLDILFVSESEGKQQIYAVQDTALDAIYNISRAYGQWGILDPSWSTDGRKFAYTDLVVVTSSYTPFHTNIYIRNLDMDSSRYDSLNLRRVTTDPYIIDSNGIAYGTLNLRPDWNSSIQKIVFISDRINNKFNIFSINITDSLTGDTGSIAPLTIEDDKIDIYCFPSYSPDGSKIVYSSRKDGSEEIWKMDADGSNKTQLTFNNSSLNRRPRFSPDGNHISFYSTLWKNGIDSLQVFTMDANGGNLDTITSFGNNYDPAWSPDGTKLIYAKRTSLSKSYIYIINTDGSGETRLISDRRAYYPVWRMKP